MPKSTQGLSADWDRDPETNLEAHMFDLLFMQAALPGPAVQAEDGLQTAVVRSLSVLLSGVLGRAIIHVRISL